MNSTLRAYLATVDARQDFEAEVTEYANVASCHEGDIQLQSVLKFADGFTILWSDHGAHESVNKRLQAAACEVLRKRLKNAPGTRYTFRARRAEDVLS